MWGNSLGWTISAALVVLTCAWLYIISNASSPTPPTDFSSNERNFAAIALPTPPPGTLPAAAATGIDAAALYRQAIDLCLRDRPTYDNFSRLGKLDSPDASKLDAINLLLQAAPARDVKIFTSTPSEIITYAREKPPLDALQLLGRICIDRFGLLNQRAGNNDEAMKHYQAGFALGWHLAGERLTYDEFAVGLELISKSSAAMARLDRKDLTEGLRDFDHRRIDYVKERIDPGLRITRAIDANIVGTHTGDVFELAKRAQERMWRVEAILALGRVRYFAGAGGTRANQANANALLRELAEKDPDPIIRTTAAAARDLTIEQHRMQ